MKPLFYIGLLVVILGLISLVVPINRRSREGIDIGGVALRVETRREERIHPVISAALILGGLGAMAAGKRRSS